MNIVKFFGLLTVCLAITFAAQTNTAHAKKTCEVVLTSIKKPGAKYIYKTRVGGFLRRPKVLCKRLIANNISTHIKKFWHSKYPCTPSICNQKMYYDKITVRAYLHVRKNKKVKVFDRKNIMSWYGHHFICNKTINCSYPKKNSCYWIYSKPGKHTYLKICKPHQKYPWGGKGKVFQCKKYSSPVYKCSKK